MSRFAGAENYLELFSDSRFLNSLIVTVELIFIPVALQIGIWLLLAMVLKEKLPGTGWMRLAFLLPAVIPPAVSGLVWKLFIVPGAGGLSYGASVFGVDLSLDLLSMPGTALATVIVASVWIGTPFVALLMLSALESIGDEQYEAARIDGASWFQSHWHISLPEIRPVILTVAVFRILEALDQLLAERTGDRSHLGWIAEAPEGAKLKNLKGLMARLDVLRSAAISDERRKTIMPIAMALSPGMPAFCMRARYDG
ncbi:sugar ABC transporter permease (plasmid) [Chelativorans sp. AA-79]|nr:sugar ABC transporter permease [Chelativorans sp. AA-79]WEX12105.1 sugar ABC transporter permease [Chelativorans sp. AA-79]